MLESVLSSLRLRARPRPGEWISGVGRSFKTTNALESVMVQIEQRTGKVDRWRTSDQTQRWLADALRDIEPRLRRVRGHRVLPKLRGALQRLLGKGVPAA